MSAGGNQRAVVYTSVGITFCQFIGIVIFHGYNQLKKLWGEWKQEEAQLVNRADYEPIQEQPAGLRRDQWPPMAQYRRNDQCREPLLEDEEN